MAHRTQITLTDAQYERLRAESRRSGASLAELVRRALDEKYARGTSEECMRALDESFGVWRDRSDIVSTRAYLRDLRGPGLGEVADAEHDDAR